jgi:hypothetical protein
VSGLNYEVGAQYKGTQHKGTKTRRMKRFEPIPSSIEALAKGVVDSAFKIHKTLGPGLLESVAYLFEAVRFAPWVADQFQCSVD